MRNQIYFSLFISLFVFSLQSNAQIVINEISYNPPESGADSLEYIELYNSGTGHVNITGWHFTAGVLDTFPSVDLNAGDFFVTAINARAMLSVFGITVHKWSGGALKNAGETITLVDAGGNFIDSVAYRPLDPWPTAANGMGPSLELTDAASDNNDGANWHASSGSTGVIINAHEVLGTPGAENSGGGSSGPAVTISVANFQFDPADVVVAIGDSVRWINNEPVQHNVDGKKTVFTSNPEDFFSGAPVVGPWQYDHQFTLPGTNHYRCDLHFNGGMVGTVSVYDPNNYTDFPLEQLRQTDEGGRNIFNGVPTRVTGVVHGINFQPTGYSFYIINSNNVGINVFSFDPGVYVVNEGDLVTVEGVLSQFNGLLEIVPDNINVLSSGNALVSPDLVESPSEGVESSHIAFGPFTIDSIVATGTSGFNVYVTHQLGSKVLIRVDADSGIDQATIENSNYVRGVGTQFDPSFPYTSGYQILAFEFLTVSGIASLRGDAITLSPNPANDKVKFTSDFNISSVQIFSMDGKSVRQEKVEGRTIEVKVADLAVGIYTVKALTPQGIWTSLLSVIR
ncbi:MAG: lamin tail domain-containing protein [Saprospiraceae bacterium]